ncbi:MAG TPA: branched-chain amino acid ABC transporter permease, partial [Gaiellales bacterium]|nr:branched-chain amino acid ABC transporter permease [Gaiellales bacterium]
MTRRATPLRATFTPVKVVISAALLILAVLVPFIYPSPYGTGVMVTMAILVVLNASWNFLLGFAGVWNFGQLALYAAGGYGGGLLMLHASFPPGLAIFGGAVAGALLAVLLAFPTLRLYGIYTSLLTFAAAQVVQLVIQNDDTGTTGGAFGLPSVSGMFDSITDPLWNVRAYYWLYLAIVGGAVAGAVIAVLLAFPTLRLYGIYTSLLTFAAAQVVQLVIQNDDTGTTGGAFGLPSVQGMFDGISDPLWNVRAYYWLYLAIAVVVVAGLAWLVRTPFGLALRTTRDSLPYGSARGIDPLRYRVAAFAVSGALAGVAG